MSDALTNLVTAAGTLGGAGIGAYVTLRVHRRERSERVQERLFEARRAAYGRLMRLTDVGREDQPSEMGDEARGERANAMTAWYYQDGSGLLLSSGALRQFLRVRAALSAPASEPAAIRDAMSLLRTELKIELGVREEAERDVPTPR